jgi:hypothetical protein
VVTLRVKKKWNTVFGMIKWKFKMMVRQLKEQWKFERKWLLKLDKVIDLMMQQLKSVNNLRNNDEGNNPSEQLARDVELIYEKWQGIFGREVELGQESQGRIAENLGSGISEEVNQAVKNSL